MRYASVVSSWRLAAPLARRLFVEPYGAVATRPPRLPEGAFLLAANHANAADPFVLGSFLDRPVRYMANLEGVSAISAAAGAALGAFGKRKGVPDYAALRFALAALRRGEPVGIFPEGDRSWDGATAPIGSGVARLARLAGVPIVVALQRGSYLSRPRWARRKRIGRWEVEFDVIDTAGESSRGERAVAARLEAALGHDDVAWARRNDIRFECPAPAAGAARALWACPLCGSHGLLTDDDTAVRCPACGGSWLLDAACGVRLRSGHGGRFLDAPRIESVVDMPAWLAWQREYARRLLPRGGEVLEDCFSLERLDAPAGYGRGSLTASRRGLLFAPYGGGRSLLFKAAGIDGFVDNFARSFSFSYGPERWRLRPLQETHTLMWIDLVEAARAAARAERGPTEAWQA